MKKRLLFNVFLFLMMNSFYSQTNYDLFKDYSAVYVPDEDTTYFMKKIEIQKINDGENIIFNGLVGKLKGDYSKIIIQTDPALRPIVKANMKRKVEESSTGISYAKRCIYPGNLCVILFPKVNIDE